MSDRKASVVVIGGGQAGLSAGYHLAKRGFASAIEHPDAARTFVVLDADSTPGGAWSHRWESLTMATVNGIFDLPDFRAKPVNPAEPSRIAVPRYFAEFETAKQLPILRPVQVNSVARLNGDPQGELLLETSAGPWRARAIINATGTWNNPLKPHYPGQETFTGKQLHTRDYVRTQDFAGKRVGIVGGGISAVQQLEEISRYAETFWYTRREPVFHGEHFRPEIEGRATIEKVTADAESGRPVGSIVSYTGLNWSPYALAAKERGVLHSRGMFTTITPTGVIEADGSQTPLDVILWATGFRPALAHLEPLGLTNELGGITVTGTEVVTDPRVHLIGYGPSQSTVGANRAGRDAASAFGAGCCDLATNLNHS